VQRRYEERPEETAPGEVSRWRVSSSRMLWMKAALIRPPEVVMWVVGSGIGPRESRYLCQPIVNLLQYLNHVCPDCPETHVARVTHHVAKAPIPVLFEVGASAGSNGTTSAIATPPCTNRWMS
jgi:hypothetical protein